MDNDKRPPTNVGSNGGLGAWLPIATAPHEDGTHVLLHGNGEDFEDCTVVGWWCEDRKRWMPFDGFARLMPTHWMQLPAPPRKAPNAKLTG